MTNVKRIQARSALGHIQPYSPGKPIWEVQKELGLTDVIKLASNENPLGPSPRAIAAIAASLHNLHRYPDAQSTELRQALAVKLDLAQEQIIVTNGGDELITLVSEAFLEPGDEVVVPDPSFTEYQFGALLMGAVAKGVPLGSDFQYNWRSIAEAVTERTKIVYLCSPNNPTGTYLSKSDLQQLLDALPAHVLVVLDAAYSHYATEADYTNGLEFVRAGYPVLVLQTFSKIYGLAGIRVGYGAADSSILQSILQVKEPFNVNAVAQTAAIAALGDDEHVRNSRELVLQERQRLYYELDNIGVVYVESMSNFILVELGDDARSLYEQMMRQGVIVRHGAGWGLPRHVRITVGTAEENDRLLAVLKDVVVAPPIR
ncbi:MAG: histidinol-phosphate transaminase [Paenibacillus sp.]|nr:histidinol-phosphate transaminase [Paenibacillus sp.]